MANRTNPSDLIRLQAEVEHIRNFCILAHVDHGKTTLSDSLVSSNGIISARLAGKLRFLDSTEEEQKRGITMHSSAISLLFTMEAANAAEGNAAGATGGAQEEYLINLVDSPGHIDFSSDVSTAARLCDGALILVDVLEGVCTQTHAVIYKALRERMRPCLVLNKIDRLIVELRLTPLEAFHHLRRIIENVNALAFSLVTSELMRISLEQHQLQQQQALLGHAAEALPNPPKADTSSSTAPSNSEEEDHPLHQEWAFSPEKGNVQFASAIDGWSFGLMKFVNMWHKKLGLNKGILKKYLFEDYCLNVDTKKITKYDSADGSKQPMFVSLVLEPIYEVYETIVVQQQLQAGVSIAKEKLGIDLPPREANPRDLRASLQAIMRRWLPLADSILRMVVRNMPTPQEAQARRVETLLSQSTTGVKIDGSVEEEDASFVISRTNVALQSITACSQAEESPLVVFISKMMPVRVAELSKEDVAMLNAQRQRKHALLLQSSSAAAAGEGTEVPLLKPEDEVFMALGRVFSGMLHRHSNLYVLGHKYDPVHFYREHGKQSPADGDIESTLDWNTIGSSHAEIKRVEGEGDRLGCYILLGPSVHACSSVGAGNIVGIVGLEDYVFKTATLSSTVLTYPLKAITFQSKPMLKVAVDPVSHVDLSHVSQGLQQLYQVDPVVEIGMEDNGQHTMTCLGELHLDQCVKALTEKFAKCEIKVSEPIVSFRETLVPFDESNTNSSTTNTALPPPWGDTAGLNLAKKGRITVSLDSANVSIAIRNFAMPVDAVNVLEQDSTSTQVLAEQLATRVYQTDSSTITNNDVVEDAGVGQMWSKFTELLTPFESHISQALGSSSSTGLSKQLLQLGPTSCPTNMLLFHTNVHIEIYATTVPSSSSSSSSGGDGETVLLTKLYRSATQGLNAGGVSHAGIFHKLWQRLQSSVLTGFNEATKAGPLMNEPVTALGFVIDKICMSRVYVDTILNEAERQLVYSGAGVTNENDANLEHLTSLQTGQLISSVKDSLRLSMLSCPVRIVEPIYKCDLQCDQSQLGNLYAVLSKRRGHVYQEDIIEGTTMFLLSAYLPVANSFQFAQELLKKTSGSGTAPQLSFSHWQLLEQDPFWRPRTEDELEEFGEQFMDEHNRAKMWINKIRKRKGLAVDEQVVNSAEKQRTLSRKK